MKKEELIEKNKLIAEFMGLEEDEAPDYIEGDNMYFINGGYIQAEYHESWDWLMPVVEKIESIHDQHHGYFGVYISSNGCTIQGTKLDLTNIKNPPVYFSEVIAKTKIQAVYTAVIRFIKWWNKLENKGNEKKL